MPESGIEKIGAIFASIVGMVAVVYVFIVNINKNKQVEISKKDIADFKVEIKKIVGSQTMRVDKLSDKLDDFQKNLAQSFIEHDEKNDKNFPSRDEVNGQFRHQDEISLIRFTQLTDRLDDIARILTDSRTTEIESLKRQLRDANERH